MLSSQPLILEMGLELFAPFLPHVFVLSDVNETPEILVAVVVDDICYGSRYLGALFTRTI
jgi:hypothetical protein